MGEGEGGGKEGGKGRGGERKREGGGKEGGRGGRLMEWVFIGK